MPRKIALFAVPVLGAALALAVLLFLRDRRAAEAEPEPFPPGALAGYLPPDSAVILTLDCGPQLEAAGRGRLESALRNLLRRGAAGQRWMDLAGIDPFTDVDQVQVSFAAGDPRHPLWLVRGRFSPTRFRRGPDGLHPRIEQGRRVYEYIDPEFGPTLLAPVGDTLVVSAVARRLDDALAHAAEPRPVRFRYPALAALLKEVDTRQAVWLAASLEHFGAPGRLDSRALELVVRPVLTLARSITGGLTLEKEVRADFTFRAADEEAAGRLEEVLKSAVLGAPGAALLPGMDRDWLPVFSLLGTGETTRDGTVLSLRCRLPAGQAGP